MLKLRYDFTFVIRSIEIICRRILFTEIITHFKGIIIIFQVFPADFLCRVVFVIPSLPLDPYTFYCICPNDIITG